MLVRSRIDKAPVEVPHATCDESSDKTKLVTTPSFPASSIN